MGKLTYLTILCQVQIYCLETSLYSITWGDVTFHYYQEVKNQKNNNTWSHPDKQQQALYIYKRYVFPGTHI